MAGDYCSESLTYAKEKFSNAVALLAVAADLKSGIMAAMSELVAVNPDDLPQEVRDDFIWLWSETHRKQIRYPEDVPAHARQGVVEASLQGMHESRMKKIAERIVFIESAICDL